jgi:predicted RecB family nuclease
MIATDMNPYITAATFAAYLRCYTKSYLSAHAEKPPDTFIAETRGRIAMAYKARANQHLRTRLTGIDIDFLRLAETTARAAATFFVDCETAFYAVDQPRTVAGGVRINRSELRHDIVPILYSAWDKTDPSDELLVCFGALAIGQATVNRIPTRGIVVYGENHRIRTVEIAKHLPQTRQIIEAIALLCHAAEPPPLVLNRHCAACDFQSRCRRIAIERDDLSLLGGMTAKERAKCEEKGISTITQLSYGYRPRRRRRLTSTALPRGLPVKHDHKLRALAIKKGRTHVVGSPSLSIEGTPVFMDVEGIPDRDFYYLIGLRYEAQGSPVEQSFWANGIDDERDIWRECVRALREINNPRIVHYGAYESRFLKQMRDRWKLPDEYAEFVDRIVAESLNLLAVMYATIYFPTYSNGLKEIARWLGFEWTWQQASGNAATVLRRCWELTSDDGLRRKLISYNAP